MKSVLHMKMTINNTSMVSRSNSVIQVDGAQFKEDKVGVAMAPSDNFLFLGNLSLSIDEAILWVSSTH